MIIFLSVDLHLCKEIISYHPNNLVLQFQQIFNVWTFDETLVTYKSCTDEGQNETTGKLE